MKHVKFCIVPIARADDHGLERVLEIVTPRRGYKARADVLIDLNNLVSVLSSA